MVKMQICPVPQQQQKENNQNKTIKVLSCITSVQIFSVHRSSLGNVCAREHTHTHAHIKAAAPC